MSARGFGTKLFLLTAAVAVVAAGATAFLTVRQVRIQVDESAAVAAQDADTIVRTLRDNGALRTDWAGLEDLVATLARQTGQRIRVTVEQDGLIIDSDTVGGGTARPVSTRAAVTVDPKPVPEYGATPVDMWFDQTGLALTTYLSAFKAANCLRTAGVAFAVRDGPLGVPTLNFKELPRSPAAGSCITTPPEKQEPVVSNSELVMEFSNCVHPKWSPKKPMDGMDFPPPVEMAPATRTACLQKAFRALDSADTPPPLSLTLGVGDEARIAPISVWPALLAAAAVAIAAIAGTALLSRRVLRPVVTLTEAARQLGDGDLAGRVPVRGHDEIAELATSFNRMATSLQASREQQRTMVADIAHELRTPLANIRGYLEALKDGVLKPDAALFLSLYEEAVLQQRLIDDLQELAQAESGTMLYHRSRLDVAELLSTCRTAHSAAADARGVTLEVYVYQRPIVDGDADRLRQVLGNLVTNALRATPRGGTVRLRAAMAGDEVTIAVSDTGHGIATDDLPHVFDRFWRADNARSRTTGGSGLGLAIAREIVAAHQGTITVESTPGVDTTFTVRLPQP